MPTIKRKPIQLSAPVAYAAKASEDTGPRQFEIAAYTGAVIDTWWGKLAFDISGMTSKKSMPVLREHQRDRIVGYGAGAQDGKTFLVSGKFTQSTPDGRECLSLADEGYPWQASVGIRPIKVKSIGDKEEMEVNGQTLKGPAEIWLKSQVGEVSFVSLGADANTSISVFADSATEIEAEHEPSTQQEITIMTKAELLAQAPELVAELKAEGATEERDRVTQILASDPEQKHMTVLKSAIEAGTPADQVYKALFEAERSLRQTGLQTLAQQATPPVGQDRTAADDPAPKTFWGEVELAKKTGLTQAQAVRKVQASFPELHAAYLAEAGGQRPGAGGQ